MNMEAVILAITRHLIRVMVVVWEEGAKWPLGEGRGRGKSKKRGRGRGAGDFPLYN